MTPFLPGGRTSRYATLVLSDAEIEAGAYRRYLGGGAENWHSRGAFQLWLLRRLGLTTESTLLDVGCGPLRAGEHFIAFLAAGHYCGVESNPSLLKAAQKIVDRNPSVLSKAPRLERYDHFELHLLDARFDFILAFSVLQHCSPADRTVFLSTVGSASRLGGQLVISHAHWLSPEMLENSCYILKRRLNGPEDLAPNLDMGAWGWRPDESIYPLLVMERDSSGS